MLLPFSVTLRPGRPLHDQVVFAVTKAVVTSLILILVLDYFVTKALL